MRIEDIKTITKHLMRVDLLNGKQYPRARQKLCNSSDEKEGLIAALVQRNENTFRLPRSGGQAAKVEETCLHPHPAFRLPGWVRARISMCVPFNEALFFFLALRWFYTPNMQRLTNLWVKLCGHISLLGPSYHHSLFYSPFVRPLLTLS
jgi:hypothetical protein